MRRLLLALALLPACHPATAPTPPAPAPPPAAEPEPEPEPAATAYVSEDVTYQNPASGLTLAGTLTIPERPGPHPAVLLISGSGAQDRDSTIFGHRPFAVIADHLSRRGIAVLRVDDRGVGGSERGPDDVTSEDFATDVEAGVLYLRARPEVDPKRVGLVGHSEGGLIAPMVAAEDPEVAAIVLLAGPGVPGKELLVSQSRAILQAKGMPEETVASAVAQQEQVMTAVAGSTSVEEAREGVLAIVGDNPMTRPAIEAQIIPWLVFFVKHDPREDLRRVHCPVLALGGSLDTQVVASENLPAIEAALKEAENPDVTVDTLEGLNHLFQPAETGDFSEYEASEVTFDEGALQRMGDWLTTRLLAE